MIKTSMTAILSIVIVVTVGCVPKQQPPISNQAEAGASTLTERLVSVDGMAIDGSEFSHYVYYLLSFKGADGIVRAKTILLDQTGVEWSIGGSYRLTKWKGLDRSPEDYWTAELVAR